MIAMKYKVGFRAKSFFVLCLGVIFLFVSLLSGCKSTAVADDAIAPTDYLFSQDAEVYIKLPVKSNPDFVKSLISYCKLHVNLTNDNLDAVIKSIHNIYISGNILFPSIVDANSIEESKIDKSNYVILIDVELSPILEHVAFSEKQGWKKLSTEGTRFSNIYFNEASGMQAAVISNKSICLSKDVYSLDKNVVNKVSYASYVEDWFESKDISKGAKFYFSEKLIANLSKTSQFFETMKNLYGSFDFEADAILFSFILGMKNEKMTNSMALMLSLAMPSLDEMGLSASVEVLDKDKILVKDFRIPSSFIFGNKNSEGETNE